MEEKYFTMKMFMNRDWYCQRNERCPNKTIRAESNPIDFITMPGNLSNTPAELARIG